MEITYLLECSSREQLRGWFEANYDKQKEVWVTIYRTKQPPLIPALPYVECVEEALCFGWIDSTVKRLSDGRSAQRLSPRRKNSHWTECNLARCRRLINEGRMTAAGLAQMPLTDF